MNLINLSSVKIDRRSTDTRQRLIDTTLDLIDSNGWHAVTLSRVARACGVTTPACYKHFPSKTSLFEAAARRLSASLGERADAVIQDDPLESLVGIGTLLVDLAAEHPHLFEFNQISPAAIAALDRLDDHPLLALTRGKVERLAAQQGTDPTPLHLLVWSCLQGYTQLIAVGATTADTTFIRAALRAIVTIGDS